jgi:hypothetical protein
VVVPFQRDIEDEEDAEHLLKPPDPELVDAVHTLKLQDPDPEATLPLLLLQF